MQVIDDLTQANLNGPALVTVGSYDGVHIGHQHLLRQMCDAAHRLECHTCLVTFYPQPKAVLQPNLPSTYLTPPAEKADLLEALGLDLMAVLPFTPKAAKTPAVEFITALVTHLRMRQLWVGPGFALGRNREGDIPALRQMGETMGFKVIVVDPFVVEGDVVSSTRIRHLLSQGDVRQAAVLLGRYPSLIGQVIQGARRGRLLGFPTANLSLLPELAIPADGVYACFVWVGSARHPAVTNIGVRPSFDGAERTVETHLLGFRDDLYQRELKVEFVERLRPEKRFESLDQLVAQIGADTEKARVLLSQEPEVWLPP